MSAFKLKRSDLNTKEIAAAIKTRFKNEFEPSYELNENAQECIKIPLSLWFGLTVRVKGDLLVADVDLSGFSILLIVICFFAAVVPGILAWVALGIYAASSRKANDIQSFLKNEYGTDT